MTILFNEWTLAGSLDPNSYPGGIDYNGQSLTSFPRVLPAGWVNLIPDPLDSSKRCLMFVIKKTDAPVISMRTELSSSGDGDNANTYPGSTGTGNASTNNTNSCPLVDWVTGAGVVRWYRFQYMIPSGYQFVSGAQTVLLQVHERADATDFIGEPPIWLMLDPDTNRMIARGGLTNPANAPQTTTGNYVYRDIVSWPIELDVWVDVLIRGAWSWTSNGQLDIWKDRRKVYTSPTQPNTFNNEPTRSGAGNYPKYGVYEPNKTNINYLSTDRVVYHRGLIVGDQTTTFAQMFPEVSGAVELPIALGSSLGAR